MNFVAENAPTGGLSAALHARVGCLRNPHHGVAREFDSDHGETHSAQAEAESIALLSNASKYRLLERYVARNVNDEK